MPPIRSKASPPGTRTSPRTRSANKPPSTSPPGRKRVTRSSSKTHRPLSENPLVTKADLQEALISFLDPLASHTSPGGARIKLGSTATHYDEVAAQLEGFARPLWGLASLIAGGGEYEGTERWIRGLANGTDPEAEGEFWGWSRDRDQRMVEMSPIGFSLAVAGDTIWEGLSEKEREGVTKWLMFINDKEMPNTNWLWFRVFGNLGLAKVGAKWDPERLKKDLDHLDTFYLGEGWSRDGPEGVRQLDYYSGSFAIQYAQLVYSKLAADTDPVRSAAYRDRARQFALDHIHYYDEDGRAIPFGRSTTYRMAMSAFWGACAFADLDLPAPLTWGHIKGLLFRNIRWWISHPSIFTSDGCLTIGYTYPNMYFTENYNSPGSPYWGMKAFIPLALSEDHPFWTSPELPLPRKELPLTKPLSHPSHIVSHLGGHTFLLSSGQHCHYPLKATQAKYGKFAYSSYFGFSVPTGSYMLDQHAPDSMLSLSSDGGEIWLTRRLAPEARIEIIPSPTSEDIPILTSKWNPWPDVTIETILVPPTPQHPNWHLRLHTIRSTAARKFLTAEAGFAIYGQEAPDGRTLPPFNGTLGRIEEAGKALAVSAAGAVGVADITPEGESRRGEVLNADANSNLVWNRTVIPFLHGEVSGEVVRYATAVYAVVGDEGCRGEVPGGWREGWEGVPEVWDALARRAGWV